MIVAGGGVTTSDAGAELRAFAGKLSIPVATALNAKTMFPSDHPLAVGVPGSYSRACANQALCEADLVFFIGSHAGGQVTNGYTIPPRGTPAIQLDINPEEIGRNYPIKVGLQGDVRNTLRRMIDHAVDVKTRKAWVDRVQELVDTWKQSVSALAASDNVPMRPERLCQELSNQLPPDAILVSDTGHSGVLDRHHARLETPGSKLFALRRVVGLGPAGVARRQMRASRPPLSCVSPATAAFGTTSATSKPRADAASTRSPWSTTITRSIRKERRREDLWRQNAGSDELWLFPETDFAAIAESMGCFGITVHKPSEIQGALEQALDAGKPAVIDIKTDVDGIARARLGSRVIPTLLR